MYLKIFLFKHLYFSYYRFRYSKSSNLRVRCNLTRGARFRDAQRCVSFATVQLQKEAASNIFHAVTFEAIQIRKFYSRLVVFCLPRNRQNTNLRANRPTVCLDFR